jgi:hypothetical protein
MAGARVPLLAVLLGAALGLVLGTAVGVRIAPDGPSPLVPAQTGNAPAARDPRIAELEAEVARWRDAYEALAREDALESDTDAEQPPVAAAPAVPDPGDPQAPPVRAQALDAAALEARGYTEDEIRRLQERYEAYELALLYLNDRARREGWRQSPRFTLEQRRLTDALQADLGDRDYDAVLFGSGQSNRVQVAGVLVGSAAERAGLRDGDEIYAYDGRRIFDGQALLGATVQGTQGAQTEMVVRRDGQDVRILLPRGPIGIRLLPARVPPDGYL